MNFIIYGNLSNEITLIKQIENLNIYTIENNKLGKTYIDKDNLKALLNEPTVQILEIQ